MDQLPDKGLLLGRRARVDHSLDRGADDLQDMLLSDVVVAEIERALPMAGESFLPMWEEHEAKANWGPRRWGEVVQEVRAMVAAAHVTLLLALADNHLARPQPRRAIPILAAGLDRHQDWEEIAIRLAIAYGQTGQRRRAAEIRDSYGLGDPA